MLANIKHILNCLNLNYEIDGLVATEKLTRFLKRANRRAGSDFLKSGASERRNFAGVFRIS